MFFFKYVIQICLLNKVDPCLTSNLYFIFLSSFHIPTSLFIPPVWWIARPPAGLVFPLFVFLPQWLRHTAAMQGYLPYLSLLTSVSTWPILFTHYLHPRMSIHNMHGRRDLEVRQHRTSRHGAGTMKCGRVQKSECGYFDTVSEILPSGFFCDKERWSSSCSSRNRIF